MENVTMNIDVIDATMAANQKHIRNSLKIFNHKKIKKVSIIVTMENERSSIDTDALFFSGKHIPPEIITFFEQYGTRLAGENMKLQTQLDHYKKTIA